MKKVLLLIGGFFLAFVVLVMSAPFFVDIDKYRPDILAAVNQKINGKAEIGKLSLSLWGAVKVGADGVKVSVNGFQKPLVDSKEFRLEIPFLSILTFRPEVVAVFSNPVVSVEKNSSGKLNVMELVPVAASSAAAPTATSSGERSPASTTQIPAFLVGASLGLSVQNGKVSYQDFITKADYRLDGLELKARNLSFARTMDIQFEAPVKGSAKDMKFDGIVSGNAEIAPVVSGGALRSAKGQILLDASKLEVAYGKDLFRKTKDMAFLFRSEFDGDDKAMLLKRADLTFADIKVHAKGTVALAPELKARVELESDGLKLGGVEDFLPLAKAYGLKGLAKLIATVEVQGQKSSVKGDLSVEDGEVFMKEFLKAPMKLQIKSSFTENSFQIVRGSVSAPDSDLQITGNIMNFQAPKFQLVANGKSFNLDQVMAESKTAGLQLISEAHAAPKPVLVNPMAAMSANPVLKAMSGTASVKLGKLTAKGAVLEAIDVDAALMPGMVFQLKSGTFRSFGGSVAMNGAFSLASQGLDFKTTGKVSGVQAKQALVAYFPKYQNTVEGKFNGDWNLSGVAYPEPSRVKALNGTLKLNAQDGTLRTADFKDSVKGILEKVPFLKNAKVPDVDEGFKNFRADLKFSGGIIQAEPVELTAKGKGFDVKGKSKIDGTSLEQESYFDLWDPQGVLPKEISQGAGKASLQLRVTGLLTSPKTDYGYTVSKLASTAGKAAAKDALQKGLGKILGGQNEGGGQGGDPVKNIGDALKKKMKLF